MEKGIIVSKPNAEPLFIAMDKCPPLKELQALVDGYIELTFVDYKGKRTEMIVNEEGKCRDLELNYFATDLWLNTYIDPWGYIAGTAILLIGIALD